MNAGFTKLFGDIVTSTIWQEPNDCKVLWITILALKEKDHVCRATVPALAKLADISLADCDAYLERFQQPDKYSRSKEHEGRRIKQVDGGFLVLNGARYQEHMSVEVRREQVASAVARYRRRKRNPDKWIDEGAGRKCPIPPAQQCEEKLPTNYDL